MEFTVKVFCIEGYPVKRVSRNLNLEDLDKIRLERGDSEIEIQEVKGYVEEMIENPEFSLSEKQARETGRFRKVSSVRVYTQEGFLNGCVEEKVVKEEAGLSYRYKIKLFVSEEKFLELWEENDYADTIIL